MTVTEKEEVLTPAEAAKFLKLHVHTIRRAIIAGRLKAFRLGEGKNAGYRILKSEIEKVFNQK